MTAAAVPFRNSLVNCATIFNGIERREQAGIANASRCLTFRRVLLTARCIKEWLVSTRSIIQFVFLIPCE